MDEKESVVKENEKLKQLLMLYGGCKVCENFNHDDISCSKGGNCNYEYFSIKL